MTEVEKASIEIENALKDKLSELVNQVSDLDKDIELAAKDFREAAALGDIRENAAFTDAEERLKRFFSQKYYILKEIDNINSSLSSSTYVSTQFIRVGSTVKLNREDTKEDSIWRIYGVSSSDISRRILSSECDISKMLMDKVAGDFIITKNKITGIEVKFNIVDVY